MRLVADGNKREILTQKHNPITEWSKLRTKQLKYFSVNRREVKRKSFKLLFNVGIILAVEVSILYFCPMRRI